MGCTNVTATKALATDARDGDRSKNPYVGPRSFTYGEQLFGRTKEISDLRDILIAQRIVLFYSPSGAGKTSLLEAGLRPELEGREFAVLPRIRVGYQSGPSQPVDGASNRYVISTILGLEEGRSEERRMSTLELGRAKLGPYLDDVLGEQANALDPCLFFDQFEELFTLDPTDHACKAAFLEQLGIALRNRNRWALFSMREDYIAQLDPYLGRIPTRFCTRYRLDLLGPVAAREAICEPARRAGAAFTDEAADRLIDDLRTVRVQRGPSIRDELGIEIEPVQLQVVGHRLWSGLARGKSTIELADVAAAGTVDDALIDYYDEQVRAAAAATGEQEIRIRDWAGERLITDHGFRSQVLEGPGIRGAAVLAALEDAHLIRADHRRGTQWYELCHDRLVGPVQMSNDAWSERHFESLLVRARAWSLRGRPSGLLMRGAQRRRASGWAKAHEGELLPRDREFLAAARRRGWRKTILSVLIAVLVVGGVLFAVSARPTYFPISYSAAPIYDAVVPTSVEATSSAVGHGPEQAVDGKIDTHWEAAPAANLGVGATLVMNFDRPVNFESIRLRSSVQGDTAPGSGFVNWPRPRQLQVTLDAHDTTTIAVLDTADFQTVPVKGRSVRQVAIEVTGIYPASSGQGRSVAITELEFYQRRRVGDDYLTVVASSVTATSRSSSVAYLVDGDLDTVWTSDPANDGVGQAFSINFAQPVDLDRIRIAPGRPGVDFPFSPRPQDVLIALTCNAFCESPMVVSFPDRAGYKNIKLSAHGVTSIQVQVHSVYGADGGVAFAEVELQRKRPTS